MTVMKETTTVYRCTDCDRTYEDKENAEACSCKAPELLDSPRIEQLRETVKEYIDYLSENGYTQKDGEHWVFEAAVEAFYGDGIWTWYNERYDE